MNVQELYQQKLTTAEEAVKIVKSGDWVDYGWCCNQPVALDKALAARKDELFDVKIHGGVTMWMPEVCKADDAGDHFTWTPGTAAVWIGRSSARAWAISAPCAILSCPVSIGTATPPRMWL